MDISITIDSRENELNTLLRTHHVIQQLDIGDIIIQWNNYTLVFERKNINDLKQSIIDGRYKEQKTRLIALFPINTITYIIEGLTFNNNNETSIIGATINTLFRDNIRVVITKNIKDTAAFIDQLVSRIQKKPYDYIGQTIQPCYNNTIKPKKKDNIDIKMCFLIQLSSIPMLSIKIAEKIATHTNTSSIASFINLLQDQQNPKQFLCNIPGIGKNIADKICTFMGINIPTS